MAKTAARRGSSTSLVKPGIVLAILFIFVSFSYYVYQVFYTPNVDTKGRPTFVRIPTGASYEQAMDSIEAQKVVVDRLSFRLMAKLLKYPELVKPGFYELPHEAGNYALVSALRSGRQTPVKLTFNNVRLKSDLIKKLAGFTEAGEVKYKALLSDPEYVKTLGFDTTSVMSLFIPNTYEIYWTTTPQELIKRMKQEYDKFWTPARLAKAKEQGLTPEQVSSLASIVQAETAQNPEKPRIAGVYLNRLRKNHPLEADPTLVYASGDFSLRRVLNKHKAIPSPYNTYMNTGLPPGPINLPSIASLEAVLNAEKHDYFYFCAKEDFSGYHTFAKTFPEHLKNARTYQAALDRAKIL